MAGKNPTPKKAKELLATARAKERDKHEKSSLKNLREPRFRTGDPVWILTVVVEEGKLAYKQSTPRLAGTVESLSKIARPSYNVRCADGVLRQDVDESLLEWAGENAKVAKTGVH
jgi:hypothetical protein